MSDNLDRIPHTVLREGWYWVHITVDLLAAPQLAECPDAFVHGRAIQTFAAALREKDLPLDMARTTIVLTTDADENEDLALIGQKKYTWTFRFPVPLFHPATTL